jgi:hypothetical protein
VSENTNIGKPGSSDNEEDDEEQVGEFVNEITPTNMPEPVPDPSWTYDDDEESQETNKPDTNAKQ